MDLLQSNTKVTLSKNAGACHSLHSPPILKNTYKNIHGIKNNVCENKFMISDKDFGKKLKRLTAQILMPYAKILTEGNDSLMEDLCSITILKIIKNKESFLKAEFPAAYAKRILKNSFIDRYRRQNIRVTNASEDKEISGIPKDGYEFDENGYPVNKQNQKVLKSTFLDSKPMKSQILSMEQDNIQPDSQGNQEISMEYQELLVCIKKHNEIEQTILSMLAIGHSYEDIQEALPDFSIGNLRVKAKRARKTLAECMGKNYG